MNKRTENKNRLLIIVTALMLLSYVSAQTTKNIEIYDIAENPNSKFSQMEILYDTLPLQYNFSIENNLGLTGIESDGDVLYCSKWLSNQFYVYSFEGALIDSFTINGVENVRDIAYDGQYFYGSQGSTSLFVMDFESQTLVNTIEAPVDIRALAYNNDNNSFYANNWSTDIVEFDLEGNTITSFPIGSYGSYYGFAYDNFSSDSPFLWGFSQEASGAVIVQISLSTFAETGFTINAANIVPEATVVAGGLFTQPDIIEGTVTIGGIIQNQTIFGYELCQTTVPCNPPSNLIVETENDDIFLSWQAPSDISNLGGYTIYKNEIKINDELITDLTFVDSNLENGDYSYFITANYIDDLGVIICESTPTNVVHITIDIQEYILGGNVIAGLDKMNSGRADAYQMELGNVYTVTSVDIVDTIGYYYFFPFPSKEYYIHAIPDFESSYNDDYIPTYYGDKIHWENAETIFLNSNIYDADIIMSEYVNTSNGIGYISGAVKSVSDKSNTTPMGDVLVMLLNNEGYCIKSKRTNNIGSFSFSDLSYGDYSIIVEIVGKHMPAVKFNISEQNPSHIDQNFIVNDDEIALGINDEIPSYIDYISNPYPDPCINYFTINIGSLYEKKVTLKIYSINGNIVSDNKFILNQGTNKLYTNTQFINPGIYTVSLIFDDSIGIIKKLIITK